MKGAVLKIPIWLLVVRARLDLPTLPPAPGQRAAQRRCFPRTCQFVVGVVDKAVRANHRARILAHPGLRVTVYLATRGRTSHHEPRTRGVRVTEGSTLPDQRAALRKRHQGACI